MTIPDPDKNDPEKIEFQVYINGEPQGDYPPDDGEPADFTIHIGGEPKHPETLPDALLLISELRARIDELEWALGTEGRNAAKARHDNSWLRDTLGAVKRNATTWAFWATDVMERAALRPVLGGMTRGARQTELAAEYWAGVAKDHGHLFAGAQPRSNAWGRGATKVEVALMDEDRRHPTSGEVPTLRTIREQLRVVQTADPELFH